jgi:hypothetical protein
MGNSLGIEVGYLLDERQAGDPGEKPHVVFRLGSSLSDRKAIKDRQVTSYIYYIYYIY